VEGSCECDNELRVPQNVRTFLSGCTTGGFSIYSPVMERY
jgi:hypothetical protein